MSRVAFVTGGAGGIGAAICEGLAADGHKVVVADLEGTATHAVADEVGGLAVTLDVTDLGSVQSAVADAASAYGSVEICLNCAGWDRTRPFLETDGR